MKTLEELTEDVRQAWEAETVTLREMDPWPSPWRFLVEVTGGKSLYYMSGARSTVFSGAESAEQALEHALEQAPKESLAELREFRRREWEKWA